MGYKVFLFTQVYWIRNGTFFFPLPPSSFAEEKYISFLRVYDHYSSWSLKLSRKHCSNNESLYLIARKETFGTSLKFITHAGYYINFDYHTLLQKRSYYRLLFIINRIIARIVITLFLEQSYRNVLLFFSFFFFFFLKNDMHFTYRKMPLISLKYIIRHVTHLEQIYWKI